MSLRENIIGTRTTSVKRSVNECATNFRHLNAGQGTKPLGARLRFAMDRFGFQTARFKQCFSNIQQAPPKRLRARDAMRPRCAKNLPPGGRGECRVPSAPAASCAHGVVRMHTSIHSGGTGNHPAFPHAMVLTAYFVISPAIGLFCHRRPADEGFVRPG